MVMLSSAGSLNQRQLPLPRPRMFIFTDEIMTPKDFLRSGPRNLTNENMDRELSAAMKDIVSPTFLPPLDVATVFDILVYTANGTSIPDGWDQTHAHPIPEGEGEHDTLKGLTAPRHQVALSLAYREED